jgi:peroxiredoxin
MAMLASPRQLELQGSWTSNDGELVESLLGQPLPALRLACTTGGVLDLAKLAIEPLVVFVHPGTETSRRIPQDPDGLLGSGCTLQSSVFREHVTSFAGRRLNVVGINARPPEEQRRFCRRERLQYPLLSDGDLKLADAIDLPTTLSRTGERIYDRITFIAHEGIIDRVFYPVPIPRRNALDVLAWLDTQGTVL